MNQVLPRVVCILTCCSFVWAGSRTLPLGHSSTSGSWTFVFAGVRTVKLSGLLLVSTLITCVADEKCNQEHLKPIFLCLDAEKDTPERCKQVKDSLKSHHLYKETFHHRVAIVTGEDVAKVSLGLYREAHEHTCL